MRRLLTLIIMTLCLGSAARAQRYDRGYDMSKLINFTEKGSWMVGGTAQWSTHKNDNYHFLILEDINSDGYRVMVSPFFTYMVKDNMGIGFRVGYNRTLLNIDSANMSISDIDIDVSKYHYLTHSFSAIALMRNYIPLGSSRRFAIVSEMQLGFTGGRTRVINGGGDAVTGAFEKNYSVFVGVNPGMMAFVNDHLAIELNVGMLGFQYQWNNQLQNQVYSGDRRMASVNFQINIFRIGFGLSYYFNPIKSKEERNKR